jgi:hypothetical protein
MLVNVADEAAMMRLLRRRGCCDDEPNNQPTPIAMMDPNMGMPVS